MQHQFYKKVLHSPKTCSCCHKVLWGFLTTASACSRCGYVCHPKCAAAASNNCRKPQKLHLIRGVLRLRIVRGSGFPKDCDPFCEVSLDRQKARSQTRYGDPVWDETLLFLVENNHQHDVKAKAVSSLHNKIGAPAATLHAISEHPNELASFNYDQYVYIEVFDQDYLSPSFIGSAVIPSITKWTEEEELIVDLMRGGVKSSASLVLRIQYFPIYSEEKNDIISALEDGLSKQHLKHSPLPSPSPKSSPSAHGPSDNPDEMSPHEDAPLFVDHFGFGVPPQLVEFYLSSFEFFFQEQLHIQQRYYADHITKYIHPHGDSIHACKEVIGYARAGISLHQRGEMWQMLSGSKKVMRRNPGVYKRLLEENAGKSTAATQQIERDLHRTFVGNSLLNTPAMVAKLQRVLSAYSFLDKTTGYCQSLNFIAALFLFLMDEEEAFWLLVVLIQDYLPSYYDEDLLGSKTDTHIFETFVQSDFPEIGELFHKYGIPISLKVSPWFLCLFVSVLPTETSMRVLDWLFAEGSQILFSVGLALFELNADLLKSADSFDTAYALFSNITDRAFVGDQIFQLAYTKYHFRRDDMDKLRADLRDEFRSRDQRELLRKTNLSEEEFSQLLKEFSIQTAQSVPDSLNMTQFQQIMARIFPGAATSSHQSVAQELFTVLDVNQDGTISIREFLMGISTLTKGDVNVKAKLWFKVFDRNEDGLLDFVELKRMFDILWSIYGGELNNTWLDSLLKSVEQQSGQPGIDLRDFKRACRTLPLLSEWIDMGFGPLSMNATPHVIQNTAASSTAHAAPPSQPVLRGRSLSQLALPQPIQNHPK